MFLRATFLLVAMLLTWRTDARENVHRVVGHIPDNVRAAFGLSTFYKKWVDVGGMPVVGSEEVCDQALLEAAWLIDRMIGHQPEVLRAMAKNNTRFSVMSYREMTTDIPEHSDLTPKGYWDKRARGLGATPQRPSVSCGEENLLGFPGDPYSGENILIHEFAHAIHERGLNTTDPTFDVRLQMTFDQAIQSGKWKGAYASTNRMEYWAEGVQSWFDTNRQNDNEHNRVNTRAEIKQYDPRLATLLEEVFGNRAWRYSLPATRAHLPHLDDYATRERPTFVWPKSQDRESDSNSDAPDQSWIQLKVESLSSLPSFRSRNEGGKTQLLFTNETDSDIFCCWIDENGKHHQYLQIPSDGNGAQSTFAGHAWVVKNNAGKPVALFRAATKPGRASVE